MRTKTQLIREWKKEKCFHINKQWINVDEYIRKSIQSLDQLRHEHRNLLNHFHSSADDVVVHTVCTCFVRSSVQFLLLSKNICIQIVSVDYDCCNLLFESKRRKLKAKENVVGLVVTAVCRLWNIFYLFMAMTQFVFRQKDKSAGFDMNYTTFF